MARVNKFDFPTKEAKLAYLDEIITFFKKERDEEVGYVAAEAVLDFFVATLGEKIYEKALYDAKKVLKEGLENIEVDLNLLTDK